MIAMKIQKSILETGKNIKENIFYEGKKDYRIQYLKRKF